MIISVGYRVKSVGRGSVFLNTDPAKRKISHSLVNLPRISRISCSSD